MIPSRRTIRGLSGQKKTRRSRIESLTWAKSKRIRPKLRSESEPRDFGEVKIVHLHRGNHHVEGFFARGAHRRRHCFNVIQQIDYPLIEAGGFEASNYASALDQECSLPSQA